MNETPLLPVSKYVTREYDYIRTLFCNAVMYQSYIEQYIKDYEDYLENVIHKQFPLLDVILKRKVTTVDSMAERFGFKVKLNQDKTYIYIIGREATEKYNQIVQICRRFDTYLIDLKNYLRYFENKIICLSKSISYFRTMYTINVSMCLNSQSLGEMQMIRDIFGKICANRL